MTSNDSTWVNENHECSKQLFLDLFHNKISHIQLENFLTSAQCKALQTNSLNMKLGQISYDDEMGKDLEVKYYLYEHYVYEQGTIDNYLAKAKHGNATYQALCDSSRVNPVLRVKNLLSQFFEKKVHIAQENGVPYNTAIVRDLKTSALLHADYAGFSPDHWSVSKVIAQFGWNIYLTDPGEGGNLVIYNRLWELSDQQYYLEDSHYAHQKEVVANASSLNVTPRTGLLVFFNSRNFHEIEESTQSRMTIGGHAGLTSNGEVLLWV